MNELRLHLLKFENGRIFLDGMEIQGIVSYEIKRGSALDLTEITLKLDVDVRDDTLVEKEKTTATSTVDSDDRQDIYEQFAERERVANLIRELHPQPFELTTQ